VRREERGEERRGEERRGEERRGEERRGEERRGERTQRVFNGRRYSCVTCHSVIVSCSCPVA
jgi:hypothetical protein